MQSRQTPSGGGTPGSDPWAPDQLLTGSAGAPRGRIAKGWHLLGLSWRELLRANRNLLVLPAISACAVALASAAVYVAILVADQASAHPHPRLALIAATALTTLPVTFITVFCNVGFLAMVQAHLRGEQPSVRGGLRFARSRLRTIVLWSLLSAVVGGVLRALEQLPTGDWIGKLLGIFGGLAWGMATCFVIPAIVVDGTGVKQGIGHSAKVFRERWGESVTGQLTIGVAAGILVLPLMLPLVIGMVLLYFGELPTGAVLVALGVGLLAAVLAAAGAVSELFQLLMYRETTEGKLPGPFSPEALGNAFQPHRRLWPRRAAN